MLSDNVINMWGAFSSISEENYTNSDVKYSLSDICTFKILDKLDILSFKKESIDGIILKEDFRELQKDNR